MVQKLFFWIGSIFILCASCTRSPKPLPPSQSDACTDAQNTLDALHCPQAYSAKDASFQEVCVDASKEGIDLKPDCIADAKSCDEVDACH